MLDEYTSTYRRMRGAQVEQLENLRVEMGDGSCSILKLEGKSGRIVGEWKWSDLTMIMIAKWKTIISTCARKDQLNFYHSPRVVQSCWT